jgi:hypothetical protein
MNDMHLIEANQIAIMQALALVLEESCAGRNAFSVVLRNHAERTQAFLDTKLKANVAGQKTTTTCRTIPDTRAR